MIVYIYADIVFRLTPSPPPRHAPRPQPRPQPRPLITMPRYVINYVNIYYRTYECIHSAYRRYTVWPTCITMYSYVCVLIYLRVIIYDYGLEDTPTQTYIHIHTHTNICINIYIYIYIYIYIKVEDGQILFTQSIKCII